MLRILYVLLGVILLGGLAYWFLTNPGLVTLNWFGLQMQVPVSVAVFGIILFFVLLIFLRKIIVWIIFLPYRIRDKMQSHKMNKAKHELMLLVRAVYAENVPEALKHMKRAKNVLSNDPFYLWFSARVQGMADLHMDENKSLGKLMEKAPFLALRGQVESALQRNDFQSARESLEKAREIDPGSAWVLKNLFCLYKDSKQYSAAEEVIDKLEDLKFFTKDEAKHELAKVYELMIDDKKLSAQEREEALRKAHYLDPTLAHVTEEFAANLLAQGHETYAISALEATWKVNPKEAIGDMYVKIHNPDSSVKAYELVKKLTKSNSKDNESQLLLGKYALKAKLWGDARGILTKLAEKSPTPRVCHLLSELELKEHNNLKSAHEWALKGCGAVDL